MNLGDPAKDAWARMVAPNRDVTGVADDLRGKKTFAPIGAKAGFVFPMAVQGEGALRQKDPYYAPKALWPSRAAGYIRSSDAMGSWYYSGGAAVAKMTRAAPLSFVERFAKNNAACNWKQNLMGNDALPRRWVGGPVITPPVSHLR